MVGQVRQRCYLEQNNSFKRIIFLLAGFVTRSGVVDQKSGETSLWARIEELLIRRCAWRGDLHLSLGLRLELGRKWLMEMLLVSICRIESVCDCSALDASSVIKFT